MKEKFDIRKVGRIFGGRLVRKFDTFICHNKLDVDNVVLLKEELERNQLKTWFDEDQILPGEQWQRRIEDDMTKINSALVCIGDNGWGPFHDIEEQTLVNLMVRNDIKLIPVILGNVPNHIHPHIPLFLQNLQMVDLRKDLNGISKIVSAIKQI